MRCVLLHQSQVGPRCELTRSRDLGVREGRGRIINVSSMYGLKATGPHLPSTPYVASKHGETAPSPCPWTYPFSEIVPLINMRQVLSDSPERMQTVTGT